MNDGVPPNIAPPVCNRLYNLSDDPTKWLYLLLTGPLADGDS